MQDKFSFVLILGRSNIGKSTLLNKFVKKKISIISNKLNTTKSYILGIVNDENYQIVYIDTPGLSHKRMSDYLDLNKKLELNIAILIVEINKWSTIEELIKDKLIDLNYRIIVAINKIDKIRDKRKLLPYIKFIQNRANFHSIIPICAINNFNIDVLHTIIKKITPYSKHLFQKGLFTNCSQKFIISEFVRESLINSLYKEIPYNIGIRILKIENKNSIKYIEILILVKKHSYKKILIGKGGQKIKFISMNAKKSIQNFTNKKIYLNLLVKYQK